MLTFLKMLYFSTCSLQMTTQWSLNVSFPSKLSAENSGTDHCVKGVQIRSFFWSIFSRIRTEHERHLVSLRIQYECGKIRTRKNPVFGHISHSGRECAWFSHCRECSPFGYTLLLFSSDLLDELFCFPMYLCFVSKGCVANEKVVDCTDINEMLPTVVLNKRSITTNTTVTDMLFHLFTYFGFHN